MNVVNYIKFILIYSVYNSTHSTLFTGEVYHEMEKCLKNTILAPLFVRDVVSLFLSIWTRNCTPEFFLITVVLNHTSLQDNLFLMHNDEAERSQGIAREDGLLLLSDMILRHRENIVSSPCQPWSTAVPISLLSFHSRIFVPFMLQ